MRRKLLPVQATTGLPERTGWEESEQESEAEESGSGAAGGKVIRKGDAGAPQSRLPFCVE